MLRIAVDAMGGDHAPDAIIGGALIAARRLGIGLLLVGARDVIEDALDAASRGGRRRRAHPRMRRSASRWPSRRRPRCGGSRWPRFASRPRRCRDGQAAALFSAGHTGAAVMAAHAAFGRLPGVDRPALATIIPTRRNPAVLLDSGATVECRPQHLVQFAVMGSAYARVALGCESPRVGLLSVGEEESKGNELTREAHQLLKSAPVRFVGNVEGRDVYSGEADVIVCDGFTGNVTLKISEGLVETVERLLHEELSATVGTRVGYLLSREAFRRFRKRVDYAEYGGAPLIGLDGLCVIGHGRSSAKAVRSAIMMTAKLVNERLLDRLAQDVAAAGSEPKPDHEPRTPNLEPRTPNPEPRTA